MIKSIMGYAFRVSMAQGNKEEGLTQPRVRKGKGGDRGGSEWGKGA